MNASQRLPILLVLLLMVLALVAVNIGAITSNKEPRVVVYLDKASTQPATLPLPESTPLTGERAALWWSVYNKAIEKGVSGWDARYVASNAVETVYGKAK